MICVQCGLPVLEYPHRCPPTLFRSCPHGFPIRGHNPASTHSTFCRECRQSHKKAPPFNDPRPTAR